MKNLDNLFNNIRYSQELFINELVNVIEPKVVNKLNINKIARQLNVKHEECSNALKALSIAEIITYEGVARKHTSVTIIDEPMFYEIKERGIRYGK